MAKYSAKDVGFWLIGGGSILPNLEDYEPEREALLDDTTPLGTAWETHADTGIRRATLTADGLFDDGVAPSTTDNIVTYLDVPQGAEAIICENVEGNTIGQRFWGYAGALSAKFKRLYAKGKFTRWHWEGVIDGIVEEGRILHALQDETAAGNTQSSWALNDNGAATSAGGSAYLQANVVTLGGYTSWGVIVQHSTDHSTWATLLTMTNITARSAERKTVAGTVNRYLAAIWSLNGAGASPHLTFMLGFFRN